MDGKNYLKLKDKEVVRGIFRGDPYLFRTHWFAQKSVVCTSEQCSHCKNGEKSSFRFRINFIIKENDVFVPKIWEQGWTVYMQLKSLHESDYDLEETTMKVSRRGSGKDDTTYTVLPLPNGRVGAETEAKLSTIPLHNLSIFQSPEEKAPTQESIYDEDIPF